MARSIFNTSDKVTSLIRLGSLVAIATGVFALAICAFLVYASMQGQLVMEQAGRAADQRARELSDTLDSIRSTLRDPEVTARAREALEQSEGSSSELERAVRARGVPNVIDLRAFPTEVEDIEMGMYPEPDFTVIEMLLEARRAGQAPAQVHYPGSASENLAFAVALGSSDNAEGILFLRVPVSAVTSALNDAGPLDQIALIQGRGMDAPVLKSIGGRGNERSSITPIGDSRLALRWSRSRMVGPLEGSRLVIVGSVGVILLMGGLLMRRRTRVAATLGMAEPERPATEAQADDKPREPSAGTAPAKSESPAPPRPATSPPPPEEDREDLPDWLLDSDGMDQGDSPFGETPARGDDLPDLPDTLAEEDAEHDRGAAEPAKGRDETLRLDDELGDLYDFDPGDAADAPDRSTEDFAPAADDLPEPGGAEEPREERPELTLESLDEFSPEEEAGLGDDLLPEADGESPAQPEREPEPEPESEPEPEPEPESEPEPAPAPKPTRRTLIDPQLFRQSMITGRAEDNLDARAATLIGNAVGSEAAERGVRRIMVARDGRHSSTRLLTALSQGLCGCGIDVVDLGAVAQPVLALAAADHTDGSFVMVTGGYLPPDRNGFRVMLGGVELVGEALQALQERIQNQDFTDGQGQLEEQSLSEGYIDQLGIDIQLERPLKVVLDCANGIAGAIAPKALTAIGADVIPLYADVDGTFPNHHPDPADTDNLEDLKLCVRNFQADLGIALDGDGSRLAVLASSGELVSSDSLAWLLLEDIAGQASDPVVVLDTLASTELAAAAEQAGARVVRAPGDFASLAAARLEHEAVMVVDASGHFQLADRWKGRDDAIYAAGRILERLAADSRNSADIFAERAMSVTSPVIQLAVPEGGAMDVLTLLIAEGEFGEAEISTRDGLRAEFADGWGALRASGTGDTLILRFGGQDDATVNRMRKLFRDQLKATSPDLEVLF